MSARDEELRKFIWRKNRHRHRRHFQVVIVNLRPLRNVIQHQQCYLVYIFFVNARPVST